MRGSKAGEESIRQVLRQVESQGPAAALALPKGSFALLVQDKASGEIFCAIDPFGLMRIFVSGNALSDDLFALARHIGFRDAELDRDAITAFLRFGCYSFGKTFDRRIRALSGDEVYKLEPDGAASRFAKLLPDAGDKAPFDFDSYLSDILLTLEGARVSLDLTGGFDTRLLAACLAQRSRAIVESAVSGPDGNPDVVLARELAGLLRLPCFQQRHDSDGLDRRLPELLRLTNGQMGVLTFDHMHQFTQARLKRGITLSLAGVGGEVWKDFFWLQDFPFLGGRPRLKRLYRTRIKPRTPSPKQLTPEFAARFEAAGRAYLQVMTQRFSALGRTQAYDSVYAFLRMPALAGPSISAAVRCGVPAFCPLLDLDGVRLAMAMPKRMRLFARWHRETISRYAPQLARLKTTEGLSARTGLRALGDIPSYLSNKAARLLRKVRQRLNLPDGTPRSLDDPRLLDEAKGLAAAEPAFRILKDHHILRDDVDPSVLDRTPFERLLTLGLSLLEASERATD